MRKSAAVVYQFPEQLGADTQTPDGSGLSDPALMRRDTLFQQKWDPGLGGELSKIFISATSSWSSSSLSSEMVRPGSVFSECPVKWELEFLVGLNTDPIGH